MNKDTERLPKVHVGLYNIFSAHQSTEIHPFLNALTLFTMLTFKVLQLLTTGLH